MNRQQMRLGDDRDDPSIGILYYAWQGAEGDRDSDVRSKVSLSWRSAVQRALGGAAGSVAAAKAGHLHTQWLADDVYLFLRLPGELEEARHEEWLLETSLRFQRLLQPHIDGLGSGSLRAGVSLLDGQETGSRWYEGLKRALLHGQAAGSVERTLRRRAFEALLRQGSIYAVYQPIISLREQRPLGYESLTRCADDRWFDGPLALFSFAEQEGAIYSLDRLAREKALAGCGALQPGQKLFLNITASIINDPHFTPGRTLPLLERYGLSPTDVVFEITERSSIEDFAGAKRLLAHYRRQGYQIAIDDAGAGYSSLESIVELRPDYIKVDRSLVRQLHRDEMKRHVLGTFVQFADKMGIEVIAEGIEEPAELEQVREMGIAYAQGYLLGRPARMPG
ncbi:EAL domain-containing protein [Paenibacillus sp. IB182496]|uniref:EAL domain-containing protein n=1 Tax=Paenibacillus sabuli TaxID=2772509 RepID=A0A927BW85_9BACL|nr:EAL domain-containing protein [Paenibacillus sabuli]MBD2846503.1 EAL domain-containing protein [Paenibacillus sabuli]